MTDLLSKYQVDVDAEVGGVWVRLPGVDVDLKIARFGNSRYRELQQNLMKPFMDKQRSNGEPIDADDGDEIDRQLMAHTLLVGWRVASDPEREVLVLGKEELPYSPETAYDLISKPELHDFREDVLKLSLKQERYRTSALESAEKNSSTRLSTTSGAAKNSNGSARSSRRRAESSPQEETSQGLPS